MPAERLTLNPDCGFGTFAGFGKMDPGIVYKKLEAMAEGAAIAARALQAMRPPLRPAEACSAGKAQELPLQLAWAGQLRVAPAEPVAPSVLRRIPLT